MASYLAELVTLAQKQHHIYSEMGMKKGRGERSIGKIQSFKPENIHNRGRYHCTACLEFKKLGFSSFSAIQITTYFLLW